MNWRKALIAIPATVACLGAIAWASDTEVSSAHGRVAKLRLSWSARPERIERCRELTAEELAARGEHMRQRVECEGVFASYDLEVSIDERKVHRSVARGAGLRNDRPIFLIEEIVVTPGSHRVEIEFERRETAEDSDDDEQAAGNETGISEVREERERIERARRARAAIPRELSLDTTVHFREGRALVVTLDPETRTLVLLAGRP